MDKPEPLWGGHSPARYRPQGGKSTTGCAPRGWESHSSALEPTSSPRQPGSSVQFLATSESEELHTDHNPLAWFFLITS